MPSSFYGPVLASIHQREHERLSVRRSRALLALLRRSGIRSGTVVDLACGPGGWAKELARHGYRVVGIDVSPAVIALARKRVRSGRFLCGSMTRVAIPPCDAVTALGEAFNYLLRPGDVRRIFRRVFHTLRPSGLFIFDTLLPPRRIRRFERLHIMSKRGFRIWARILEDPARRSVLREIEASAGSGSGRRAVREVHRQRTYSGAELARWLRQAGFLVRISKEPKLLLWQRHATLIARKR